MEDRVFISGLISSAEFHKTAGIIPSDFTEASRQLGADQGVIEPVQFLQSFGGQPVSAQWRILFL